MGRFNPSRDNITIWKAYLIDRNYALGRRILAYISQTLTMIGMVILGGVYHYWFSGEVQKVSYKTGVDNMRLKCKVIMFYCCLLNVIIKYNNNKTFSFLKKHLVASQTIQILLIRHVDLYGDDLLVRKWL